jgi:soluble lytic murein transglycosylase-like protein
MRVVLCFLPGLLLFGQTEPAPYFEPNHRVAGIGISRESISDDLLEVRTDLMIQSQTFAILREPLALVGARRVTGPRLQTLFRNASKRSGMPAPVLEAIAYLESWGDPKAASPAGPRGIMQISEATARRIGLKVVRGKRYQVTTEKVAVRRKGKTTYKTVRRRTPYEVIARDDRLSPERSINAAAKYLAGMEQRFGGRDWAIFAYHCGEGCVSEILDLSRRASGISPDQVTVARIFFSANPARNRDLYQALQRNMSRDYSPTYWFRVKRAEQLLALYRRNPSAFAETADGYRSEFNTGPRAPNRLAVWVRKKDLVFQSGIDLRADEGRRLAKAPDQPEFFGYTLGDTIGAGDPDNQPYYLQASPAALGTLLYIAFETRRLHQALAPDEGFLPLEVTSLVQPAGPVNGAGADPSRARPEALAHASGQVIDIGYSRLPPGERECLRFVLDDLGWEGYLGFVEEGPENIHIGCSPGSREFFASVFQEALEAVKPAPQPVKTDTP